ncbi:nitrite reductase large subunit NirB [Salmonella enterica]|uniref:nitrite reductase large subunit NirB n=1 Tax=Salmonella enterica TaxID=28901 RepID=UPI00083DD136|nr:nitrite reductase large subunit NirB [Salmonella enterica]EDA3974900.1 nitrite reductase large subunit [Salmonella enterica subsp. enterica serovar Enteritidis]ODH83388.1 nitrite reductase [Salmonella enterica subsp. enterica serovar Enteritidis]ODI28735.1 nitrite reductase [Salmonella enterica subsp. enterica serovar Enteritidis]ODI35723.1 nitrite reductase [Salmonella enterica subsp. enterica serovar Enteritidis]ODI38086.1 nitrite reductase [Salmonella enterica subsp. enterica serovar Ent
MSKVRLAIIGNGMVGHRFIEDLLDKSDASLFDITVFCEEPRKAYDRVHLSSYFSHHTAEELSLVREGFYEKHGVKVLVGERAITINRQEKVIHSSAGRTVYYDKLIMATGSYPWIPPIKGSETQDCFVYRTIEDLNAIEACARRSKRGAVVGGGIGDAHGRTPGARSYVYLDESKEVYKRLIVSEDNKTLLGAVLVGDTSDYGNLLQLVLNAIELPENPDSLILPSHAGSGKPAIGVDKLPDSAQICSCFDVTKGDLIAAINKGCHTVAALKAETKAGTGCGGCIPLVTQVLNAELAKQGIEVNNNLCEHFAYSRQELFHLIRVEGIKTFEELLAKHGKGYGCEVCKPTVGSLLASCWNEYILKPQHTPLQDTNDNFLANIQKDGTYSVIPRSAGGEITPEGLVAVGRIAREFNLYTKITGSQRIGLFGAQKDDLPEIWRQLIEAGFETGHAYAKALRMAKTCVGSTWCRYGVGDSVGFGVELENRYKGIRTPHKMKFGVSGCTRECAEAQGKDVGIIATEKGWNLYVCGNGGMKPRHADLLAADLDRDTLIKYLDRFMMFYIRTADKLTRTAPWLDNLEGGIEYLKSVIIDDKLGLNEHLEEEMARLRAAVVCEWTETVNTPSAQVRFKHFINSDKRDPNVQVVPEREQHRPATPYERIPVTLVEENA